MNTNITTTSYAPKTTAEIERLKELLSQLGENEEVQDEFVAALDQSDIDKLRWFSSMGETPRHQVMNAHHYYNGLKFGFTEYQLNDCGWINHLKPWITYEEISLKTKMDKTVLYNHFTIAEGPNHKWTFGVSLVYGAGSGFGYIPSVFAKIAYKNREEVLDAAIDFITKDMTEQIAKATLRADNLNYNIAYMNKVLDKLTEINPKSAINQQLQLF